MAHWHGQFIAHPQACDEGDPAPYFRRRFALRPGFVKATLDITALGLVEPLLNGARVGDELLMPGWTSYRDRLMVSRFDVTDQLRAGDNVLGVIVGEGWAVGALTWSKSNHHYADRPALWAQLAIDYDDRTEWICTEPTAAPAKDSDWLVGFGGVRANGLYDGEVFDASLEPAHWATIDFQPDQAWGMAIRYDWPLESLELANKPPVKRMGGLPVKAISWSPYGCPVLDFGQNMSGWLKMRLPASKRGLDITIRYAEALKPNGALERDTNRSAKAMDRYISPAGPTSEWEPHFTSHGFRYAELEGWPGTPDPAGFEAQVIHSDLEVTGWFDCSDPLVNRLHQNTVWSMRSNFVSLPTDCPQRDERLGWTGDLNVFIATACHLMNVDAFVRSWLCDLMIEQGHCGNMPRSAPLVDPRPSEPTALWGDAIINVPWTLYRESGDDQVLRSCWSSMRAYIDEVESRLDERGLWSSGFQYGDWGDPDAPPREPGAAKTDRYLVAQAFLARSCAQMVAIAELIDDQEAAQRYGELNSRVRLAFQEAYVSERGIVAGDTATGYALAICFGLLSPEQADYAGRRLSLIAAANDYAISTGFAGTPFIHDALTRTGHVDAAYRILLSPACPSFLYPVRMGATTTWERWDAIRPDGRLNETGMTSLNHYAFGAVNDWLHRVVAGLSDHGPGWRTITIAPRLGGGLTKASSSHLTPQGLVAVAWQINDGQISVDVIVPDDCRAEIILPNHPEGLRVNQGPGEYHWSYPLAL
ncbi:MAG: glycoside hydrolase family 78 protein [Propionibacteriaceae bacterium]|jgi:alpha-L-rhamnosidase|nr:glycoside hydrolase family 78 protein [Propionibacteriaceae bacterium]